MKILYFDVQWGASGDMILSSLIDAGVPLEYVQKELSKLEIPGFSIDVEKVQRSGIVCAHVLLTWDEAHTKPHSHGRGDSHDHGAFRNPRQILDMIKKAGYKETVFTKCEKILMRLAQAEAAVHGVPVDEVHFHEIGAIDTIVDVAGISLCIEYLKADRIVFSALTDGRGTVATRHGLMPVPVPAVAQLCKGYTLNIIEVESELLTPTGCAALVALGRQTAAGVGGKVQSIGYGCGDKQFEAIPNALRVFLLESDAEGADAHGDVWCLESDMDHISGEIMGNVAGRLLAAGALDVSWCPVFMKKGRPGYKISVICSAEKKSELADMLMLHTRTLGVRLQRMERIIAQRRSSTVQFYDTKIQEKYCSYKNVSFTKPEYESMAALSNSTGKPILELMEEYIKSKAIDK